MACLFPMHFCELDYTLSEATNEIIIQDLEFGKL